MDGAYDLRREAAGPFIDGDGQLGRPAEIPYVAPANDALADERVASLALRNLRALFVLALVGFHSVLPYLWSAKRATKTFGQPPYEWLSYPIVDAERWIGFDLYCAWQDVYQMALMFFLSGLFAWPSLVRKGSARYLRDRVARLGAPYALGVLIIAPLALYPAYRATAAAPALGEYAREYISLPFQPNGPVWFLWPLLALSLLPPALRAFAPSVVAGLARLSSRAGESPGKYLVGLGAAATLAYVPLALIFTPWSWNEHGPFSIQLSRPLFYAVFYVAGVGVGAHGLARGLLKPDGAFARRWNVWLGCAVAMVALWMTFTALTLDPARANSIALQLGADVGFAAAGTAGFFFATAVCLRFAAVRNAFFDGLSKNALGIYALHYAPLVWLQYAMTGFAGVAGVKAAIVFAGTLLASIAAAAALRRVPYGSRLIGESSGGQAA